MRVDPAIAAMRRDRAPQQRAQAAMVAACDAWRGGPAVAPVVAGLEMFGRGAPLEDCPALADLFAPGEAAGRFAAGFCAAFAGALADAPFGQIPFRHSFDGALATLLLARAGTARLTLAAHEPGEYRAASVLFSDALRHDAVIAGQAVARLTTRQGDGAFDHHQIDLAAGSRLALDLSAQSLAVGRVERRLVVLRLHRTKPAPAPVREHSLADGSLQRQAAGEIRQSRHEAMLALLGRMARREAAPLMAQVACDSGPDALRWQALRETLALDTAEGFAALCRIARSPTDSLAAAAGALRAQLVESYPELLAFEASLEHGRCRG